MHTGKPCIMSKSCTKSARWIGKSRAKAADRSFGLLAKIISRITTKRSSSKNICSVRQSPIPCALKLRAVWASAGVSALARMPISAKRSAQDKSVLKLSSNAGGISLTAPTSASPLEPSTVMMSPSRNWRPSAQARVFSRKLITIFDAPTTQGTPRPRPITAAWLVMPPRSVKTPAAECMPRISSGAVSRRTKIQGSPRETLA